MLKVCFSLLSHLPYVNLESLKTLPVCNKSDFLFVLFNQALERLKSILGNNCETF